jgi:Holliday junction resolvase
MKKENAFYHWLKNTLKEYYFCRIEGNLTSGIPDLFTIINEKICFIELKITRTNSLEKIGLNKFQIAWHIKHNYAGGNAFILVKRDTQPTLKLFRLEACGLSHIITQQCTRDGCLKIFDAIKNYKNNVRKYKD